MLLSSIVLEIAVMVPNRVPLVGLTHMKFVTPPLRKVARFGVPLLKFCARFVHLPSIAHITPNCVNNCQKL